MACFAFIPQISTSNTNPLHTDGLSFELKREHRRSSVSWMHLTPAGFPPGMPGMFEEIEGAIQQAAQRGRHE